MQAWQADLAKTRNMIARHCKIICREPLGQSISCCHWARQNHHPGKRWLWFSTKPTIQMGTFFSQWRRTKTNYRQVTLKQEPMAPFARFLWPKPPRSQQPFADWTGNCEEAECISACSPCSLFPIHFRQRCLWAKNNIITIMLDKKSYDPSMPCLEELKARGTTWKAQWKGLIGHLFGIEKKCGKNPLNASISWSWTM